MSIFSVVGGSQAYGATSGAKVYQWNNIGSGPDGADYIIAAPSNVNRRQIVFHNPGTVDVFVYPNEFQTTGSSVDSNVTFPTPSAPGGAFVVFANGGTLTLTGECQRSWNAFARSGTDNALTVMDSNI